MKKLFIIYLISFYASLSYSQSSDFCITANTKITIKIDYEFQLIADSNFEQKSIVEKCLIDENWNITLPVFYSSIETGNNENSNLTNYLRKNDCVDYSEASNILTNYYNNQIGTSVYIKKIKVTILPEDYFQTITVYYRGNEYTRPYKKMGFIEYFKNPQIRYQLNLSRKLKVLIESRRRKPHIPNKSFTFRLNCKNNKDTPLNPGDIIYIK